ncbi:MAG: hypothetical protein WB870_12355 [Gallionellaceae bacterium]
MKRITLILRTLEVMSVRKAAHIAGASHVVVHPVSHRECAWLPRPQASAEGAPVRLDVMAVDRLSDEVVSAILATAHLGKIEKAQSMQGKLPTAFSG